MRQTDEFLEDFHTLIEGGFIAIKQGDEDAAVKIFKAASTLKPEHTAPLLGIGQVHLNKMELTQAKEMFETVLKQEPNNPVAKVLLGFCFLIPKLGLKRRKAAKMDPNTIDQLAIGGRKLIEEGLKATDDRSIHLLGKSALELLEKTTSFRQTPLTSP